MTLTVRGPRVDTPTRVPFTDLGAMTHEVRDEVDAAWQDRLAASDFVAGAPVDRFEREWAQYCGADEAVGVANGTDALVLTLRALGIGDGNEVVIPANTFVATAEAVVLAGATPRFADVDPVTALLTADTLAASLTPRTTAVIVVHLYGQTADMDAIPEVVARAGLALIEDAAQAHGATWRGRRAGSLGRAGCFSFYPGKNLGAFGDAGAVVTSDPALADTLRSLRNHGRPPGLPGRHDDVGTNSRMDTLQAAVLSAKLPRLDAWTAARRRIAARYRAALDPAVARPVPVAPEAGSVHHLAVVLAADRETLRAGLQGRGIETAVHYPIPCHLQAPYRRFCDRALPVAEALAGQVLSLPMFPHMSEEQVGAVCEALQACAEEHEHGGR
jgi:dTDP-4-amino-4,6-dideoxygalactose transaminase